MIVAPTRAFKFIENQRARLRQAVQIEMSELSNALHAYVYPVLVSYSVEEKGTLSFSRPVFIGLLHSYRKKKEKHYLQTRTISLRTGSTLQ